MKDKSNAANSDQSAVSKLFLCLALNMASVALVLPAYTDHVISIGGSLEIGAIGAALRSVVGFIATPVLGSLSDSGRRNISFICFAGTAVGLLLAGFASTIWTFQLSRILLGLFWNVNPVLGAFVTDYTPKDKLEAQMGKMAAVCGGGYIIGVVVGGLAASHIGSHIPSILAGICNIMAVMVIVSVPEKTKPAVEKTEKVKPKTFKEMFGGVFLFWVRPNLTNPLTSRLLQETAVAIINGAVIEYARLALDMSPTARGFACMWYGVVNTLLQSQMEFICKSFFKNSEDTIKKCLLGVGISTIIVPFSSSLWIFMMVSTSVSAFQAYLYPLSNSLLSRSVDAREQGSLLGGAESFISLGGIVAPLITGMLLPISLYLPFTIGAILCAASSFIFPSVLRA
ncbi:MF superfamily multidrug transporter [Planoprotostelium fungivorum]|uniref:MF superfamily multidrug transporter n=1 Tax=Planoprotostelium fungivorum TaxID=1890364 RepID=A0A2P6MQ52_9EUKA|nr:MF superfamily multidrug transporter [Planoprotostelium fungivorum]